MEHHPDLAAIISGDDPYPDDEIERDLAEERGLHELIKQRPRQQAPIDPDTHAVLREQLGKPLRE